jgi:pimeloyl-ACP methyl ester carboxylesterase
MNSNLRIHGVAPYRIAVVHGGPGACGSVAPIAAELSRDGGVLEPYQTAYTIDGLVDELRDVIVALGERPMTLIGHSWGAWLVWVVAARYPDLVRKLILVGSGPFEARYAEGIDTVRFSRLTEAERTEVSTAFERFSDPTTPNRNDLLGRIGALMGKADTYDPLPIESDDLSPEGDPDAFARIWPEANAMRKRGELLALASEISCPVVAIHGTYDPHPVDGVRVPLEDSLCDFRMIVLDRCGHEPWCERHARAEFFRVLREEVE